MSNDSIAATLKLLRRKYGYLHSEVAQKLSEIGVEVNTYTLSRWENGRCSPPIPAFIGLCRIYQIKDVHAAFDLQDFEGIEYELNREGREKLEDYRRLLILSGEYSPLPVDRVIGSLRETVRTRPFFTLGPSAGTGQFLDSDDYEMVEIAPEIPDDATFGVRVSGDSMEPTLSNGQEIWVHQQPVLEDGDIGVIFVDGEAYVKEYHMTSEGACLLSHNPKYAPIRLTENSSTKVYGKVVYPKR